MFSTYLYYLNSQGKRTKSIESDSNEGTIVRKIAEMRGRGRPKKVNPNNQLDLSETPKRGRGRPSKSAYKDVQGTIHTFFSTLPKNQEWMSNIILSNFWKEYYHI